MKPSNKVLVDAGESRGLRIHCGRGGTTTFLYRYASLVIHKLAQIVVGHFPSISLADARLKLQDLKLARGGGRCSATEKNLEKQQFKDAPKEQGLTVKQLVDLYLRQLGLILELCEAIEPFYPNPQGEARRPIGIERMLRIYFLQHWFNLSDPAAEEALYDSRAMRQFVAIDLGEEPAPDETTICKFCHLM